MKKAEPAPSNKTDVIVGTKRYTRRKDDPQNSRSESAVYHEIHSTFIFCVHTVSEGHRKPKTGRCIKALIPSKELWLANDEMTHAWKEKLFFFFFFGKENCLFTLL